MKKRLLALLLVVAFTLFQVEVAFAAVTFTGNAPTFEQHLGFTSSFTTGMFSVTSGRSYLLVLSCAVWQTTDTITITNGAVLSWTVKMPVDSSQTVGDTAMYVASSAGSSSATETIGIQENGVGFFHYCDVKVYEMTGYNGTGAAAQATSNVGGGPAPSLTYTPSSTGSLLFESASNDAHPLTAQPGWFLTASTSTDAFMMDGYMVSSTTSTASRVIAPGNSGGTNGFSMVVLEFLGTTVTATPTPFVKKIFIYE